MPALLGISRTALAATAVAALAASLALEQPLSSRAGLALVLERTGRRAETFVAPPDLPARGHSRSGGPLSARFSGVWRVPEPGPRRIRLVSSGQAELSLAGEPVLRKPAGGARPAVETTATLPAGLVAVELSYSGPAVGPLRLVQGPVGSAIALPHPLDLFPDAPSEAELEARDSFRALRAAGWYAAVAWLILALPRAWRRRAALGPAVRRMAPWALPAAAVLVTAYGGALRFEALVTRYWEPQAAPRWALHARDLIEELRPRSIRWSEERELYQGDPWSYLQLAREERGLFDAHVREPVFVLSARALMGLVDGHNIGLNLASVLFGTLLLLAAFALGSRLAGGVVGLGTGLALALHTELISLSVEGWRDEAFAFFVVLGSWSLLGLYRRPGTLESLVAGVCLAAACLTRLSALALALPALLWVVLAAKAEARARARAAALALGVLLLLIGPYLLSCAVAFGDPFYAVSYHTGIYRVRQGLESESAMGVGQFLTYGRRPMELLETSLLGLTSVPFENKWRGYGDWSTLLGPLLAGSAAVGTLAWAAQGEGRLLLVVLAGTLLPYAATWSIPGGREWRYTMPALPFYLAAAAALLASVLGLAARERRRQRLRALAVRLGAALALGLLLLGTANWLRYQRVAEDLRAGEVSFIDAGWHELLFFRQGWSLPARRGNLWLRTTGSAEIILPLPPGTGCSLDLLLETSTRQPPSLWVNGEPLAGLVALPDAEDRITAYRARIPASQVTPVTALRIEAPPGARVVLGRVRIAAARGSPEA